MKKRSAFKVFVLLFLCIVPSCIQAYSFDGFSISLTDMFAHFRDSASARLSSFFGYIPIPHVVRNNVPSAGISAGFFGAFFAGGFFAKWQAAKNEEAMRKSMKKNAEAVKAQKEKWDNFLNEIIEKKWTQSQAEEKALNCGIVLTEQKKDRIGDRVTLWYAAESLAEKQEQANEALALLQKEKEEVNPILEKNFNAALKVQQKEMQLMKNFLSAIEARIEDQDKLKDENSQLKKSIEDQYNQATRKLIQWEKERKKLKREIAFQKKIHEQNSNENQEAIEEAKALQKRLQSLLDHALESRNKSKKALEESNTLLLGQRKKRNSPEKGLGNPDDKGKEKEEKRFHKKTSGEFPAGAGAASWCFSEENSKKEVEKNDLRATYFNEINVEDEETELKKGIGLGEKGKEKEAEVDWDNLGEKSNKFKQMAGIKAIAPPAIERKVGDYFPALYDVTSHFLDKLNQIDSSELTDILAAFSSGDRKILFWGVPERIETPDSINDFLHGTGAQKSTSYTDPSKRNLQALLRMIKGRNENGIVFPFQWSGGIDDATRQQDGVNYAKALSVLSFSDQAKRRAFLHSHAKQVWKKASQEEGFPYYDLVVFFNGPARDDYKLNGKKVGRVINAWSKEDAVQKWGTVEPLWLPWVAAKCLVTGQDFAGRKEGQFADKREYEFEPSKVIDLCYAYGIENEDKSYTRYIGDHSDWTSVLENIIPILENIDDAYLLGVDLNALLVRAPNEKKVNVHIGIRHREKIEEEIRTEGNKLLNDDNTGDTKGLGVKFCKLNQLLREITLTKKEEEECRKSYGIPLEEINAAGAVTQACKQVYNKATDYKTELVPYNPEKFEIHKYPLEAHSDGEASSSVMGSPILDNYTPSSPHSDPGSPLSPPALLRSPSSLSLDGNGSGLGQLAIDQN